MQPLSKNRKKMFPKLQEKLKKKNPFKWFGNKVQELILK